MAVLYWGKVMLYSYTFDLFLIKREKNIHVHTPDHK